MLSKDTHILCERHVVVVFGSVTKASRAQSSYTKCSVIIVKIWMGLCQWMEKWGAWTSAKGSEIEKQLNGLNWIHLRHFESTRKQCLDNVLYGIWTSKVIYFRASPWSRVSCMCSDNCATALPHKIIFCQFGVSLSCVYWPWQ